MPTPVHWLTTAWAASCTRSAAAYTTMATDTTVAACEAPGPCPPLPQSERKPRLQRHDPPLGDRAARGQERLSGEHEALGEVFGAARAPELRHHRLEHRPLAGVGLHSRDALAAGSAAQPQFAEAQQPGRAATAQHVHALALPPGMAAANVVHDADPAAREAHLDRPALVAMAGIGRLDGVHFDGQALREPDRQVDEVADVAEQDAAALRRILVPAVGGDGGRAHGGNHLSRLDAGEVRERLLAERAEAAVVADPEARRICAARAESRD